MCAQPLYELDPEVEPEPSETVSQTFWEAAGSPDEPEPCEELGTEEDPERLASLLLIALAECPFKAASAEDAARKAPPQRSKCRPPTENNAALAAVTIGAALARRGHWTGALSAALAQPQGLGRSVRVLREHAAAGDVTAQRAVTELDMVRKGMCAGGCPLSPRARARRLRLALELPEACGESRRCALEDAAALCGLEACPELLDGESGREPSHDSALRSHYSAGQEPDDEECLEALGLLDCVRSELGLHQALETGEVEL